MSVTVTLTFMKVCQAYQPAEAALRLELTIVAIATKQNRPKLQASTCRIAPAISTTYIRYGQHVPLDHDKTIETSPAITREYCVVTHMRGSEWIRIWGGSPPGLLVPYQSSSILSTAARTPNGARPHRKKKKGNAKNKIERKQNEEDIRQISTQSKVNPCSRHRSD
jgi:hypothetical protein